MSAGGAGGGVEVELAALLDRYTLGARRLEAHGETLGEVLAAIERRFPGIRFRIVDEQDQVRPHMRIFVNEEDERSLARRLEAGDRIYIVGALSGGS